jgi:hypothetical protein
MRILGQRRPYQRARYGIKESHVEYISDSTEGKSAAQRNVES